MVRSFSNRSEVNGFFEFVGNGFFNSDFIFS